MLACNKMLNFKKGLEIAKIKNKKGKDQSVYLDLDAEPNELTTKGTIQLVPSRISRIHYITGKSGSGKSTMAGKYVNEYSDMEPDGEIYYLSRKKFEDDPAYNKYDYDPFIIEPDVLLDGDIDIVEDIDKNKTTMFIFDDISTFDNTRLKAIYHLISEICELGRSGGVMATITNHLVAPNERKYARMIMNELQAWSFPTRGNSMQVRYALKTYFGLSDKQISNILNTKSRFVTIINEYPGIIVEEHKIYILE